MPPTQAVRPARVTTNEGSRSRTVRAPCSAHGRGSQLPGGCPNSWPAPPGAHGELAGPGRPHAVANRYPERGSVMNSGSSPSRSSLARSRPTYTRVYSVCVS